MQKHRPKLTELPQLFDHFGGDISRIAEFTGYSRKQVHVWINDAAEPIKIGLLEALAKARANANRTKALRTDFHAFIIPHEIKHLISLYYRRPWHELQYVDIEDMINAMSVDPEAPATLRYKLSWDDLKAALFDLDTGFQYQPPTPTDKHGHPGPKPKAVSIGGPANIGGVTYLGWHQHVLMSWVGLNEQSPLWNSHDNLPTVMDDKGEMVPDVIEKTLRLLIKRLEAFL